MHLAVAHAGERLAHVILDYAVERPAVLVPENHARRLGLKMEQVHLRAEAAVVALFGLFKALQVRLQLLVVGPRGAVDALQRLVVVVAAPIGAGHAG